jgi:hypothetical protein
MILTEVAVAVAASRERRRTGPPTTATVIESLLPRADVVLAIADDLPVGTVIGRRLDGFLVRAVLLGRDDP